MSFNVFFKLPLLVKEHVTGKMFFLILCPYERLKQDLVFLNKTCSLNITIMQLLAPLEAKQPHDHLKSDSTIKMYIKLCKYSLT